MKKRLLVLLCIVLTLALIMPFGAFAVGEDEPEPVADVSVVEELDEPKPDPTNIPVYVDGERIELGVPATLIGTTTYVPIRAFATALGADSIVWSASNGSVCIDYKGYTIEAVCGGTYLIANCRCLYTPTGTFLVNGTFMAPLRALAKAFGADVTWDATYGRAYVETGEDGLQCGNDYYDSDDVYWLSHIINAEARGESLIGKIAVGNVVLNRVDSSSFPNSVYSVIFQRNQFTPTFDGSIYLNPSYESYIAAKLVLDGADVVGDALFFAQKNLRCWAYYNRCLCDTIGGHAFYY